LAFTFCTAVLLGLGDAVVTTADGVLEVAATCDGVGFAGDGAVSGEGPALQAAAADATSKVPATARALLRKRTGARTSLTIAPNARTKPSVSESLFIPQQLPWG